MKRMVVGFNFSKDRKKVLLICKKKPEWQKGLLNGVGGKVEEETIETAMRREFEEETGVVTHVNEWDYYCMYAGDEWQVNFFRRFEEHSIDHYHMLTVEVEQLEVYPVEGITEVINLIPNLKWVIHAALDKNIYFMEVRDPC